MSHRLPSRRTAPSLLLAVAAAVSTFATATTAADLPEIRAAGRLRALVMLDEKRPEFYSTKLGRPGFDAEVIEAFAKLHKLAVEFVTVASWDALVPALNEKKGDLIAGRFSVTESRAKLVAFTHEVFPTRNVVFNLKPRAPVESLEQLRTEKLGVIRGSSMVEAARAAGLPGATLDDGIAPGAYGEALHAGRITAALWGIESAMALQHEDPAIQLGMFLGPPGSLAYAVRKDEPQLLASLNDFIDNFRRTSSWSRLVVKYFGVTAPTILKKARAE
jgi:ABC-type amino acid transport substrate-binding protein